MTKQLPYYATLRRIRSFLEQQDSIPDHPAFPFRWCEETSWLVHRVAGLYVVTGSYSVRGDQRGHFWNFDPERHLYIDLTQDQFGYTRRKIVILPVESHSPLTKWSIEYSYEDFYREDQSHNGVVDKLEKLYREWTTIGVSPSKIILKIWYLFSTFEILDDLIEGATQDGIAVPSVQKGRLPLLASPDGASPPVALVEVAWRGTFPPAHPTRCIEGIST